MAAKVHFMWDRRVKVNLMLKKMRLRRAPPCAHGTILSAASRRV